MTAEEILALPKEQQHVAACIEAGNRVLAPALKKDMGIEVRFLRVRLQDGVRIVADGEETEELHLAADAFFLGFNAAIRIFGELSTASGDGDKGSRVDD